MSDVVGFSLVRPEHGSAPDAATEFATSLD